MSEEDVRSVDSAAFGGFIGGLAGGAIGAFVVLMFVLFG